MSYKNIDKLKHLINTIKYLKVKQIFYQLKYRVFKTKYSVQISPKNIQLSFIKGISISNIYSDAKFKFINNSLDFNNIKSIDWNYSDLGKLWCYNLNYFDYLRQENLSKEEGLSLISDFIEKINNSIDGLEPYPISLRVMNWIYFLSLYQISDQKINNSLYSQINLLSKRKEYHLMGNHLLENGFAFLYGAYYFNDANLYKQAKHILCEELDEQILNDGGHFELSPMYHCLMTYRMLDCYNLISNNNLFDKELLDLFKDKAEKMLSFLQQITFRNGNIPLFNDSAFGIAPSPKELFEYAQILNLMIPNIKLNDSGYRKFVTKDYEIIIDVGEIGPSYQPGHAHADTFSFELYINNRPIIIDTGTSTYEINPTRFYERSTAAHNTITIGNKNSSKVWAGHRVAQRANVKILKDEKSTIKASHNGYMKNFGALHTRNFSYEEKNIMIEDFISNEKGIAYFHFHPNENFEIQNNRIIGSDYIISFENYSSINIENKHYAPEFNKRINNKFLEVSFDEYLTTKIIIQ